MVEEDEDNAWAHALVALCRALLDKAGPKAARPILSQAGFQLGLDRASRSSGSETEPWPKGGARYLRRLGLALDLEVGAPAPERVETALAEVTWTAPLDGRPLGGCPGCWVVGGVLAGSLASSEGARVEAAELRCRESGDALCRVALFLGTEAAPEPPPTDRLGFVARSEGSKRAVERARRAAASMAPVLLTGEPGTGKARLARIVHDESPRRTAPFFRVDCGAVPEPLLAAELFGSDVPSRPGALELAARGSILLEDVGGMPRSLQQELASVLHRGRFRRPGQPVLRPLEARVLATCHEDGRQASGLSEELRAQLAGIEIPLPALRSRREDLIPLARSLLERLRSRLAGKEAQLGHDACRALYNHPWPGNVRELENALERALVLSEGGVIRAVDLGIETAASTPAGATLAEVERDHILRVLEAEAGNRRAAAKTLGIGEATLYRKLKTFGASQGQDGNTG